MLLVRHTQVALRWQSRCYGRSDIGLSRTGAVHAREVAQSVADWRPDIVIHSGLKRTRILAEKIAQRSGLLPLVMPFWQERDFGIWEGQSWANIYRATGNAMDGMIDAPTTFRPGGGETTAELAQRAMAAFAALPNGRIAVITHGGPIAAIMGTINGSPVRDWPSLVPRPGNTVEFMASRGRWRTRHDSNVWPLPSEQFSPRIRKMR